MSKNYVLNLETGKIELYFDKSEYVALPESLKKDLKGDFLFGKHPPRWVSRCKEPNLYRAIETAKKLGFTNEERRGERLSFAEQVERQAERAENRADRYDSYAGNADKRASELQSSFNHHRGDIAFMTQPITANAGGRAFKNYRDKIIARYERGMDEYRKSAYFRERADTARQTANMEKFNDVAYLDRRITEQKKILNGLQKSTDGFIGMLLRRENGDRSDHLSKYGDDDIRKWISDNLERIEVEADKLAYLMNCLETAGGILYSKENIKPGYIVIIRGSRRKIIKANPKTVDTRCLQTNMILNYPYSEIQRVEEAVEETLKEDSEQHPYNVGDILVKHNADGSCIIAACQVVKTTAKMIETRELVITGGIPKAGVYKNPDNPAKRSKPFVRKYDQKWYVSDPYGWVYTKYIPEVEGIA